MSEHFRNALSTPSARRMLLELFAYCHGLPESLQLGANHLLNHMQFKASAAEREQARGPQKTAKGRLNG